MENAITIYLEQGQSFISKLIQKFSKSNISHVFVGLNENLFIEADIKGVITFDRHDFLKYKTIRSYKYYLDAQNLNREEVKYNQLLTRLKMLEYAIQLKGKKYDYWLTISHLIKKVLNWVGFNFDLINKKKRLNCVEVAKELLDYLQVPHNIKAEMKPSDIKLEWIEGWVRI